MERNLHVGFSSNCPGTAIERLGTSPYAGLFALANAAIRLSVFVGFGILIDLVAKSQRQMQKRIQTLEGFLSICCFCKDIRCADGSWQKLEKYIGDRSDVTFSHGFCEKCARKYYPESFQTNQARSEI